MTIVLHIGVSKTGSSAIQYALAAHQAALSERGVHYPLDDPEAVTQGRLISSGNGALLVRRLNPKRGVTESSERLDFIQAYVSDRHRISLVSSEGLSSAEPELLERFRRETIGDRDVRIVAFVRDLFGHAVSSWMQRIKRHGYTGRFEGFCAKSYGAKPCAALRTYAEVFGPERMTVIHYDSLKESVFHALMRALDTPADDLEAPPRINRSLSQAEAEVLIACNQVHKDMAQLSARISDHLIYKHPERDSEPVVSPRAARVLSDLFQAEVDWVNQTFFSGRPVVQIGGPAGVAADPTPHEEIWADALEAVGRRLASVEAQNRLMQTQIDAIPMLQAEKQALRDQIAQLKAQSWFEKLKLDIARRARGRRPAVAAPQD